MDMLKSCPYCSRIHDARYECDEKRARLKSRMYRCGSEADKFRRTFAWTDMSIRVRERDFYMCLCCADGIGKSDGTVKQIETDNISVHHIVPIEEDYELRLDETNLISVCSNHHEMCERQEISREKQRELVRRSIERRDQKALEAL